MKYNKHISFIEKKIALHYKAYFDSNTRESSDYQQESQSQEVGVGIEPPCAIHESNLLF